MLGDKQNQEVAEGGAAYQSGRDLTVYNGPTVEEIRAMSLDVFRAEFYQFLGMSGDIATARAQKVIDDFLSKMQKEFPEGIRQANEPDFRYAILSAQKAHARAGDDDLEPLLIELLIERSKEEQRNVRQIVLTESLDVMSKITNDQIAALTIVFLVKNTQNLGINKFDEYVGYADKHIQPFLTKLRSGVATFNHLQYAGCGSVEVTESSYVNAMRHYYSGIFQKGFDKPNAVADSLTGVAREFIIPSPFYGEKYQVFAKDIAGLEVLCKNYNVHQDDADKLKNLLNFGTLTDEEMKDRLMHSRPYFAQLFQAWDGTQMKNFSLTSVGMAIAHASVKQLIPDFAELSIWIN